MATIQDLYDCFLEARTLHGRAEREELRRRTMMDNARISLTQALGHRRVLVFCSHGHDGHKHAVMIKAKGDGLVETDLLTCREFLDHGQG